VRSAASQVLAPKIPSATTIINSGTMTSMAPMTFTVAEHTPEDGEYRATRRFLINPECLKPFKLSAGEVVAILGPEDPDPPVSVKCSICFRYSDCSLTRRTPLQLFSVGVLWPDSELEKDGHSPCQTHLMLSNRAHFQ